MMSATIRCLIVCSIILLLQPAAASGEEESSSLANENTNFLRGTNITVGEVETNEHQLILDLAHQMSPRPLRTSSAPESHQFFHLHHMKSGGTSLSTLIRCGVSRQGAVQGQKIRTAGLSECSSGSYHKCVQNEDDNCRSRIKNAVTMNFCSPLAVSNYFNWTEADAITMMRHPVDRVWSMFRFQTKSCFKCTDLKQVYKDIDNQDAGHYGVGVCLTQLQNHITRNMQKNLNVKDLDKILLSDEERVADAIDSIKNRFAVVGVIEQLEETLKQFTYTFPWLKEEIEGSAKKCPFPHSNGSPKNNRCGPNGSHWDLPAHPDAETRKAIEDHNRLDILVYEAALARFELQKKAIRLEENLE